MPGWISSSGKKWPSTRLRSGSIPQFALGLSWQRLAVCRNDFIEREEALIDFYDTAGKLLGQAVAPALYGQYAAVLPAQFSLGFELLDDRQLACLHYDHDQELFVVVLYRF